MTDSLTLTQDAPYFEQWMGIWAMREMEFTSLADLVRGMNLSLHLAGPAPAAARDRANSSPMTMDDAVALIEMRGRMQKQSASMGQNVSTVAVRRAVRAAAADPEVGSIFLVIDSPGGTVAGTKELADDVAAAARVKPVVALIEDMGASAAFWVASQATQVFAQPTAVVGSIGTYGVVWDQSAQAAKEGIKVHVVRAGAMKGAGTPGTEITPEQLAEIQKEVNTLNEFFIAGVAGGRKLSTERARELATGQVWIGQEAVDAGLIDGVSSFDQALATARAASKQRKGKTMAAASYQELVASCVGASPQFICSQLEAGASIEVAVKNWMGHQKQELDAARKELEESKAREKAAQDAAAKNKEVPGNNALPAGTGGGNSAAGGTHGSAAEEFNASVEAKVKAGMSRSKAVAMTVKEDPERAKRMNAEATDAYRELKRRA